ncbi:hypothetical protein NCTGTJJY_CDS0097 [Serratia phage 92A1]|nr:hypothetical protein NCTGTJJY_CDS0097 [Serratia phage 92A1]
MIRKNSWHYKLISRFGVPKTKIGYWSSLLPACLAYSIPFVVLGLLVLISGFAGQDFTGTPFDNVFYDWIAGFIAIIVGICGIIAGTLLSLFTILKLRDMITPLVKRIKFKRAEYE